MSGEPVLVPVSTSPTLRETVEYTVESALDTAAEDPPRVRFVYVHAPREFDPRDAAPDLEAADDLLDRVAVWAEEDAGGESAIDVSTVHVGEDTYLFSPGDVAARLREAAADFGAQRIVLDPEYDPGIGAPILLPLENDLSREEGLSVESAPVRTSVRRVPIVGGTSARRIGAIAGLSFLFYQVLAGAFSPFDLVTGAITATIVALSLSRVSFGREPSLRHTPLRILRGALYVPYLLWEIVKANVAVAAVILNPRGEVDPQMTRISPAVYGALPVTSLANSITLTPGTLTVRVEGNDLLVHTLLPGAREDLFDGALERAIRFVFYGRRAMRIESLADRGAAEVLPVGEGTGADAPPSAAGSGAVGNSAPGVVDDAGEPGSDAQGTNSRAGSGDADDGGEQR